jgi:hypothetical protein
MKASNLALRREDEPVVMAGESRLARAVIAAETNESLSLAFRRRPRLSLRFQDRHFERRSIEISDQGLRLFRVR